MQSKAHRMRRVFGSDGRALIVAMDHAGYMGPVGGLIDPLATVRAVVAGGADAVMTTLGTAKQIGAALDGRGLILSVDLMAPDPAGVIEQAIEIGADHVKTLAYWGGEDPHGMRNLARYAVLCDRWGIPFQAEMIPFAFGAVDKHTPENIAIAARIAAECGADYVKTMYTGDADSFRRVVEGATVPVIILGGARSDGGAPITRQVADAIRAGGSGIAFGRNIWSTPDPEQAVRELVAAVHGSSTRDTRAPQAVRA
ncbi:MAG TPA: fructose-bisphosphate aldolase [Candidatus Limnocylindria bacterium]|jgi:DhnA family fructose-bisphosphate aldolase class Ia